MPSHLRVWKKIALLSAAPLALVAVTGGAAQDGPSLEPRAGPPMKPAEIDETLAIGGEELAARKLRSRMTVDTVVNGKGPFRFVVDSGADTSVVSRTIANRLALPAGRPAILNSMTETRAVDRVRVDSLQLGTARFDDLHLPVLDSADIGGEGMIGLDALVQQRLMMDFEKRVVSVDDATAPLRRYPGEIVVVGRLQRGQLILTSVRAERTNVDAVIDTGTEITIGNSALRAEMARRNSRNFKQVRIIGVTGKEVALDLVVVSRLKIGTITLSDVPVAFADVPPFTVFGIKDKPALLIGTDVMEKFRRVSLDFGARKARFQLRRCGVASVRLRTAAIGSRLSGELPSTCAR